MALIFLRADAVAAKLGINRALFLRQRRWMETELEFPMPLPHSRKSYMWRADQVEAWLQAQGTPSAPEPTNVVPLHNAAMMAEASTA